jgi:hypothetical protein
MELIMSAAAISPPAPNGVKAIVLDILLNVALPYGGYVLLRHAGQSEPRALILSAIIPAAVAAASILQRRRMNYLSLLVIGATALSLLATMLSGSAWFALVRPSFVTGALALIFAGSLAAARPTLFYLARDTMCPTADSAAEFEARWVQPGFRRTMRRLTLVWAAFLGGEAIFRFALAAIWPDPNLIAATQILWVVLPVLLVRWSIAAGRRWGAAAGVV